MKRTILIVLGIIIIIIAAIAIALFVKTKDDDNNQDVYEEIKDIRSFHFSYDKGYAINAYILYEIRKEDERYIAKIKLYGVPEEEAKEVVLDNDKMQEIEKILNKHKVSKWDGFKKSDNRVQDGNAFTLSITYGDNKSVSASGYMKWPDNYQEVRDELDNAFEKLVDE